MSKTQQRSIFVCQNCGHESLKWLGHCPDCEQWNCFVEAVVKTGPVRKNAGEIAQELSQIQSQHTPRLPLPFREFNQVLGGGIVPGSLVLIGGDPGIGKSTLLLESTAALAQQGHSVLYVSGEESANQIKLRANRLGLGGERLYIFAETSMELILEYLNTLKPQVVVIDSIQSVYLQEMASAAGSVVQVRECTMRLMRWAKATDTAVIIIGHVTKDGSIAGPNTLEHIVDVVLYFEGERFSHYRLLRSVKNRFGSTNEIGIFEMVDQGLIEVQNPSQAFLSERPTDTIGSTIVPTIEGTRPLLVEIQALTNPTYLSQPRRTANGIDFNRLILISAVLTKRARIPLSGQDIIVNVIGGLKINEPAADLGIALSIASSFRDKQTYNDMVVIGEIGLSGELRGVAQMDRRISEAAKLGFKRCLIPNQSRLPISSNIEIITAHSLTEALKLGLTSTP